MDASNRYGLNQRTYRRLVSLLSPRWLMRLPPFALEIWTLAVKESASCLFAGAFFIVLALSNVLPLGSLPRYDFILIMALLIQAAMFFSGLETGKELKALCLFHLFGLLLEIFKTSSTIGSWSYPEFAYSKVFGVPLYSGFMYAAVASYVQQAWNVFETKVTGYPRPWLAICLAGAVYLNFFTHHYIGDYRWLLIGILMLVFWPTKLHVRTFKIHWHLPINLVFFGVGIAIWVAENIATFFGAWSYPNQKDGWQLVHLGKVSSWGLLIVVTFVIVIHFKLKQTHTAVR
jgi:uncharacterized membrane protein YoaT (DUF817 family)